MRSEACIVVPDARGAPSDQKVIGAAVREASTTAFDVEARRTVFEATGIARVCTTQTDEEFREDRRLQVPHRLGRP